MPDQSLLSELIGDIYEASYRPSYWPVVIEKICRITNSQSGGLVIQDMSIKEANAYYPYGWSEEKLFDYARHRHHDPAFTIMQDKPVGEAINIQNTRRHALETSDYYEDVRLKHNIGYLAGAKVIDNEVQVVGLGLHRTFSCTAYDDDTLQLISELVPHLQRALRIHREFIRLRIEKSALSAGIDNSMLGLVLLDHLGEQAYMNPVAKEILENHPAVTLINGIITATNKEDAAQLRRLIHDCLRPVQNDKQERGGIIGLHHISKRHPLAVMVKPVNTSELANMVDGIPVYAAIYLSDPNKPLALSADNLETLYGLTRAESQLAIALVGGMGVDEIAQTNSRSINTVRTQLRSIFQKTNTNSQADLIRVLLTSVTR